MQLTGGMLSLSWCYLRIERAARIQSVTQAMLGAYHLPAERPVDFIAQVLYVDIYGVSPRFVAVFPSEIAQYGPAHYRTGMQHQAFQ
jgi:hypothetical protein